MRFMSLIKTIVLNFRQSRQVEVVREKWTLFVDFSLQLPLSLKFCRAEIIDKIFVLFRIVKHLDVIDLHECPHILCSINHYKPSPKAPDQRRSGEAVSCHSEKITILLQDLVAYPEQPLVARSLSAH